MDAKFFDSLYEGDSANGVKLGMGLTGGDFWPRVGGCQNLYRGQDGSTIDFENILAVTEIEEESITVPGFAGHQAGGFIRLCLKTGELLRLRGSARSVRRLR